MACFAISLAKFMGMGFDMCIGLGWVWAQYECEITIIYEVPYTYLAINYIYNIKNQSLK